MAYNSVSIRTAITELLEGSIGSVRVVPSGVFLDGVFQSQPLPAKQANVLQTASAPNWFDVLLQPMDAHEATPISHGSHRIETLEVRIQVWRHYGTTVERAARLTAKGALESALDTAVAALSWPGNLASTAAGVGTGIISGFVHGAGNRSRASRTAVQESAEEHLFTAEIVGAIDVVITDGWYVSSSLGSDSYSGMSEDQAFATLAAATAVAASNQTIYLHRGSRWREQLTDLPNALSVRPYGTGERPIIDARDVATNTSFSATVGQTNVYEIAWSHDFNSDGGKCRHRVWEDGVMLTRAASLAACDATAGSFWADTPGAGGPDTIYVHPNGSTDPTSDGKEYQITKRRWAVEARDYQNNLDIENVETIGNAHADGSLVYAGRAYNCIARDGRVHNVFVAAGTCDSVQALGIELGTSSTMYVSYMDDGGSYSGIADGSNVVYRDCVANPNGGAEVTNITGYYVHTNSGDRTYGTVQYECCQSLGCDTSFDGANANRFLYKSCTYTGALSGHVARGESAQYGMVLLGGHGTTRSGTNNNSAAVRYNGGTTSIRVHGHRCYKVGTGLGAIWIDGTIEAVFTRCTFPDVASADLRIRGAGTDVSIHRCIFGDGFPVLDLGVSGVQVAGFSADSNVYSFNGAAAGPRMRDHNGNSIQTMGAWRSYLVGQAIGDDTEQSSISENPQITDPANLDFTVGNANAIALGAGAVGADADDDDDDAELSALFDLYKVT